ncbi:metal ABC transporter ATP-binding protein [Corynebacterium cystitidis]|uniref:metal ABC transporter ATP-binding protein n=1 Tax=Corynebacterium cystitidis TaxID=35757 RepID=UPI00211EDD19|nr:metal ABC transporter ATP-binding protein [Corynebacterium cystitidis]
MTVPVIVEARGLTVRYNQVTALDDVDIDIPEGIVMGIVGPNGSGKSTTIKAMLSLIDGSSGRTLFFGQPLSKVRRRVGYMPQHSSVDWNFPITVADVVLMGTYGQLGWLRRPGKKEHEQATRAMEAVNITDLANRQIGELSGGQRQRVFLARTLAGEPDLLFMDEPFQGIDHVSQQSIVEVFHTLREQGKTIVVVHHDLSTVPDLCDWVTLISSGTTVASGPVADVFTQDNIQRAYGTTGVVM